MKPLFKKLLLSAAIAGVSMGAIQAQAYEAGDMIIKAGYVAVNPDASSQDVFPGVLGANNRVDVDDGAAAGISFTYMLSSNVGVEILGATPFTHDIVGAGALKGKKLGETKHLPPTVSIQYYMPVSDQVSLYAGVGLNYTVFFSEDTKPLTKLLSGLGVTDTKLSLDNSFGAAFSAGVDIGLNKQWGLNLGVYAIDIDTKATLKVTPVGSQEIMVKIDPIVYRLNAVYKF